MKELFTNTWLQLGAMTVVFICTLAIDWVGIMAYLTYFALWANNEYNKR